MNSMPDNRSTSAQSGRLSVGTTEQTAKVPAQRLPERDAALHPVDRLVNACDAAGIDEAALERIVDIILGGTPHSAKDDAGTPVCITCNVKWPCPPTVTLILSARGGSSAVAAAEAAFMGETDGAQ